MILRPGQNIWRLERAARAAVLIDGASYFQALREALLRARRSVFIVGWDIHSRTRLVGSSGHADDGYPQAFGEFLTALANERPGLEISLLLWDYAMLYAGQREMFPTYTFRWNTPPQVSFCLDSAVPVGSSQHQKLIVIDDAIAFSGGLDVTIRRWDTSEHAIHNPHRIDPNGVPYPPFHDVQMLVDGDAAAALALLVRERWTMAAHEEPAPIEPCGDPWPISVDPDFTNVEVGIARTQPQYIDRQEIREVEALFHDAISSAETQVYIENQFVTSSRIAQRLAARLEECPGLEALIVVPNSPETWLEEHSMRYGRSRFVRTLKQSPGADRVGVFAPMVTSGAESVPTMVHSKVIIVDNKLLRIGSANLNNRSMSVDTECDLIIEARNSAEQDSISAVRNRLLADHCGVAAAAVAKISKATPSLLAVAERLTGKGHRLQPVHEDADTSESVSPILLGIADPERPIGAEEFVSEMLGGYMRPSHVKAVVKLCIGGAVVLLLALIWHFTPLAALTDPETVRDALSSVAGGYWGPVVMVVAFIVGGLVLFPLTILILGTAAALGPLAGFLVAAIGALLSAITTYFIGTAIGRDTLRSVLGPRLSRLLNQIRRSGILAVASLRLVPVAPFTVVNLVAGASDIRFRDFLVGTIIGLLPGLIALTLLGYQISELLTEPSALQLAILAGAVAIWIAVSVGIQILVNRFGNQT
jgi:phosphatidylserine/phosphatidylglycerophosphate/cardiolipin synthase-like enzyme/uncharacterized membrane protein YdjX (TVP38/TMEM64 family)